MPPRSRWCAPRERKREGTNRTTGWWKASAPNGFTLIQRRQTTSNWRQTVDASALHHRRQDGGTGGRRCRDRGRGFGGGRRRRRGRRVVGLAVGVELGIGVLRQRFAHELGGPIATGPSLRLALDEDLHPLHAVDT